MKKVFILAIIVSVFIVGCVNVPVNPAQVAAEAATAAAAATANVEEVVEKAEVVEAAVQQETADGIQRHSITMKRGSIDPAQITVNKGSTVELRITGTAGFHKLKIPDLGLETDVLGNGQMEVLSFTASKGGSFSYECDVGDHSTDENGKIVVIG